MKNIVIIGAGGFGREVVWLIEEINRVKKEWNILGFIDENPDIKDKNINGYRVLGNFNWFKSIKEEVFYVCAIGNSNDRKIIVEEKCKGLNIRPATLIHPSVQMDCNSLNIGQGSIICASVVCTVNINIGDYVIINLDSTIGHDVKIDKYATICPSVNISGNCIIGKCSQIGTGCNIIQGIKVGEYSIIGAGAVVVQNIEKNTLSVGVPAKVIKKVGKL